MAPPGKRLAWIRTLEAHTRLLELMDAELRRDCGVPLAWYDVLIKIWLAPGHRIRMAELADQVLLSRSWLTRRIVQMEDAGLVTRASADDDGRGVYATMTARGRTLFARMEDSHARSIATHFSAHLTQEEARIIAAAFARISAAAPDHHPDDAAGQRGDPS